MPVSRDTSHLWTAAAPAGVAPDRGPPRRAGGRDPPTLDGLDDQALATRAGAGDRDAFDVLVVRHQRAVYHVCFRFLRDHAEASDAMQDAFLKAWRALPRFKGDAAFATWLYRVCRQHMSVAAGGPTTARSPAGRRRRRRGPAARTRRWGCCSRSRRPSFGGPWTVAGSAARDGDPSSVPRSAARRDRRRARQLGGIGESQLLSRASEPAPPARRGRHAMNRPSLRRRDRRDGSRRPTRCPSRRRCSGSTPPGGCARQSTPSRRVDRPGSAGSRGRPRAGWRRRWPCCSCCSRGRRAHLPRQAMAVSTAPRRPTSGRSTKTRGPSWRRSVDDLDVDAAARAGLLAPGETTDRALQALDADERAELATPPQPRVARTGDLRRDARLSAESRLPTWPGDDAACRAGRRRVRADACAAPPPAGDPVVDPDRMSPREVQRLFDAYVAMQAQERLQLSETQYPQFLPRLKTLLDLRRSASRAGRRWSPSWAVPARAGPHAGPTSRPCARSCSSCAPSTSRRPPTCDAPTRPSTRSSTCGSRRAFASSRIRSSDARSSC